MLASKSNKERVGIALNLLRDGLRPFLEQYFKKTYGDNWEEGAREDLKGRNLREKNLKGRKFSECDAYAFLNFMRFPPKTLFNEDLDTNYLRSLASELLTVRNKWAHGGTFTLDDAYRTFDSAHRLLAAISAPQAIQLEHDKRELRKLLIEEEERSSQPENSKQDEVKAQQPAKITKSSFEITWLLSKLTEAENNGLWVKAIKVGQHILRSDPTNLIIQHRVAKAYRKRGEYFHALGGYDLAINHIKRAIDLNPKHPEYYFALGQNYGDKTDFDPQNPEYYFALKQSYGYKVDIKQVKACLAKAIKRDPRNEDYYSLLAYRIFGSSIF